MSQTTTTGTATPPVTRRRPLRRRVLPVLVLLALAALAGWLLAPRLLGPRVAAERVVRADVVRTVVASGRVQTPHRVEIGVQITGTAAVILADRGDRVVRGQPLLRLEDSEARAAVAQAEAALAQTEARLRQIEEVTQPVAEQALRQAQATLDNARRAFERASQLRSGGFSPQATLDDARKALDIAEAQARSARLQAEGTRPGGIERTLAETALRQTRASLAAARARLAYTQIEAPSDGIILARNVEAGDVVQPGKALFSLSPAGEPEIVVQLDERNLALVRLGQPALASADAWPERRFRAEVLFINPAVDPQRGSVEVKLRVPDPPEELRQDMTVSVDIEVARSEGTLVLSAAAVNDITGPAPWVLRLGPDGRAERREVRLGLRGPDRVEVREGLEEGDLIIPLRGAATAALAGRRVRILAP